MRNSFPKSIRRVALRALLIAPALALAPSCTNLTEVPHDALTPANAFHTDAERLAGVASVYAQLRAIEWVGFITLEDLTTDVAIVPTRGNDWYDNGQWLDLHRQTYTPNSAGTLAFLNGAWSDNFSGIARANLMIHVISQVGGPGSGQTLAELRTLRAWYYYMLQDMFGRVPLVTKDSVAQYHQVERDSMFKFIEKELLESRDSLPLKWDATMYGRMTKGAANAILASLYLNAGVFSKKTGVNPSGYNSCAGVTVSGGKNACQAAIDAADAVINSGVYSLATDWTKNFSLDNKSSPENIFVVVHSKEQALGGNWPMRTLHYNQLQSGWGSPWNGFATTAEAYSAFDSTDDRRSMWLVGQAYDFETGNPAKDRTGNALIFTVDIPDANKAGEGTGVRFNKFPPLTSAPTGNSMPNDFTFFRLAEMYLIKAEALNELGSTGPALTELNRIHNRHSKVPIVAGTQQQMRDAILKERLLEFAAEGKRRTDLIRHGKFLSWTEASANGVCGANPTTGCPARASHRILFPVPSPQIQANPNLTQNPGY